MKRCSKCETDKPLTDFHKHRRMWDGYSSSCKVCKGKSDKKYRSNNRSRLTQYHIQRRYGITEPQYQALLTKQNGVCAICSEQCTTRDRLSVDHCHRTGKLRGLLCNGCNTGIGQFNEDINRLCTAINYLTHHNEL